MPDLLALEFETKKVLGIDAQVSPSGVRIRNCFELVIPDELDVSANREEAGEWLKKRLGELNVATTQVVATFPRELAVVRHIAMPDVPDEELPELVRYQAGLKSALPVDELALDFLPLPKADDATARDVLITTIPKQALKELTDVITASGLQLVTAGLSPVSAAEVVLRSAPGLEGAAKASLVVTRHGPRVEISILKGPNLVFSHFTQVGGTAETNANQAVIAAVARSMMGLTGPISSADVTHAWLLGSQDEFAELAPALTKRLNPSVQILDPFEASGVKAQTELPQNRSAYSALVGSLLAQSQPLAAPVDFLAPRQPPVKPNLNRRRAIIGTAAAACIALAVGGTMYVKINKLNRRIDDLRATQSQQAETIKAGEPMLEKVAILDEWTADRRLWLDELYALNEQLPPADRAFLSEIQLSLGTGNNPATIAIDGFSRERKDVENLSMRILRQDARYKLEGYHDREDDKDPYHKWKFDTDIELKPDAPAVKLTAAKPAVDKKEETAAEPDSSENQPSPPRAEGKKEEAAS